MSLDIARGDTVVLRDGRRVVVTDIADQDPAAYPIDTATGEHMPVETIIVGLAGREYVVTDMSEIIGWS